jgi:hypothetical protein
MRRARRGRRIPEVKSEDGAVGQGAVGQIASEALIERLADWGVDTVFGLPGDGINGILEGLRRHQDRVRFILVHHEEAAAIMATGYAKATGRLGVCLANDLQRSTSRRRSSPRRSCGASRARRRLPPRCSGTRSNGSSLDAECVTWNQRKI